MAGLGLEGAGGAIGTFRGLQDWMQGRRQKVVQGQRDEDRLREQRLQDQALATEAANREYDIARQRILDAQHATTFQNQQTTFGQQQTEFQQEQAARLTPEQMADVFSQIDTSDQIDGLGKIGLKLNIQKLGTVPREAWDLLTPKPPKVREIDTVDERGRPVTKVLNEADTVGQTYAKYVAPVQGPQGPQPSYQWVLPAGKTEPDDAVYRVPQQGDTKVESTSKGSAKITGLQRKALGYYNRAQEASKTVEELEPIIAKSGLASDVQLAYAPNFAQTPVQQQYRQGQRAFTEARLRKDSGAAVPQSEYDNDAKTYFAQPNDSDATIEKKRRGRQRVLESIKFESGDAYEEFYGEPNTPPGRTAAAKTVTRAQLEALARKRGTDVATQAARAAANGYTVAD